MNIEKTISEHAVSDILTPMLESQDRIVTEDVAPLFDQATGLDTPPASGTVTTTIEESRSVITAIIRKAWTAPITMLGGASVLSYIAAAYTYLRNRLQGNETYGIPDRRSEISASSPLAANLALLNDRKIGGVPEAADGIPLVRILGDSAVGGEITQLIDETKGWTLTKNNIMATIRSLFPNIAKIKLGCKESVGVVFGAAPDDTDLSELEHIQYNGSNGTSTWISKNGDLHLPKLKDFYANQRGAIIYGDELNGSFIAEEIETISGGWDGQFINTYRMPRFYAPKLRTLTGGGWHERRNLGASSVDSTDLLTEVIVGYGSVFSHANYLSNRPNVIKVEFRVTADTNVDLAGWNPTNVLADQDNLQQFLQNFRDYIALRLTDNGSGKTLTLSQAVRNAIHAAESTYGIENIIITNKGWTISPAPN